MRSQEFAMGGVRGHRRSQDFGSGGAQTRNHIGEDQKKVVLTVRFRIYDWGVGGRNVAGDQFWIGGGQTSSNRVGT